MDVFKLLCKILYKLNKNKIHDNEIYKVRSRICKLNKSMNYLECEFEKYPKYFNDSYQDEGNVERILREMFKVKELIEKKFEVKVENTEFLRTIENFIKHDSVSFIPVRDKESCLLMSTDMKKDNDKLKKVDSEDNKNNSIFEGDYGIKFDKFFYVYYNRLKTCMLDVFKNIEKNYVK